MKNDKRDLQIIPDGLVLKIAAVFLLFFEIVFTIFVLRIDVLPVGYLIVLITVLLLIGIGIMILLTSRKSEIQNYFGMIFTVLVCMVCMLGCFYLYRTDYTLEKISEFGLSYERYDVVVAKSSQYEDIGDIRGKEVTVINNDSRSYLEAQGKLANKENVRYTEVSSLPSIENAIKSNSEAIAFVSDSNYDILCEESKRFKESTHVIYKIKVETKVDDTAPDIDVTEDSFNIYISGMDVWGDIRRVARSDVNMIVTVNPKTRQILLTSIPRDSYVALHQNGEMDKLTHTGIYGINETLLTVEDWLGVHSDYYVKVNFTMLRDLVNAIGGITVYSDYNFSSHLKHYHYKKGWNEMSGRAALYFARERKAFKNNDEQRVINQQRVVKAIIRKMTRSEVILADYADILDAVGKYMQTNMSKKDMSSLVRMQLSDMDKKWTINAISISGKLTQRGTWSMGPERPLDVFVTDKESVKKAAETINSVMYPENDKPVEIKDVKSEKDNIKPTAPITYTDRNGNVIGHSDE